MSGSALSGLQRRPLPSRPPDEQPLVDVAVLGGVLARDPDGASQGVEINGVQAS